VEARLLGALQEARETQQKQLKGEQSDQRKDDIVPRPGGGNTKEPDTLTTFGGGAGRIP